MKTIVLLLAAIVLAGCGAARDTPQACAFLEQARIPVVFEAGVPIVDVKVNGTPLRLIVDTGANSTVITADAAERAGVARDSTLRVSAMGVGGAAPMRAGTVGRLEMATARQTDMFVMILMETKLPGRIDGLLGADVLSKYDLDIDLAQRAIGLYAPRNCPSGNPNWAVASQRLPRAASGAAQRANFFDAVLDGVTMNVELDTGSATTVVQRKRVLAMGITADQLAKDRQGRMQGVAPGVQATPQHRFQQLVIGTETLPQPVLGVVTIGEIDSTPHDILLGGDYLRTHRVWISYASDVAYVARNAP